MNSLYESINEERQRRELSWAGLSVEVGVSASTIRRFAGAEDAEADGVLALVRWLGVAPETFVRGSGVDGDVLADGGFVRVDMQKLADAEGDLPRGRTRTTVQRLAAIATANAQTIASLTRISIT